VTFYANYTNRSSGLPITGATCNISFDDEWNLMPYADGLFSYTRFYEDYGNYIWQVECNMSGYETLILSDDVQISRNSSNVRKGYCTAEYIDQGNDYVEGKLQRGDKMRIYCAPGVDMVEGEKVVVRIIPEQGLPTSKHIIIPDHLEDNMVVYP